MKGDITIGAGTACIYRRAKFLFTFSIGTIVHPKATIFAAGGPIVIGSGCIIEEGAIILNRYVITPCSYESTNTLLDQTKRSHADRR